MTTEEKRPPVVVASFDDEDALWEAVRDLEGRKIGLDFIGAYVGEDPTDVAGERTLCLLSALAPRRLHDELKAAMAEHGATDVGDVAAFRMRYGFVPHPGALDYFDMRLPMGREYPLTKARRGRS